MKILFFAIYRGGDAACPKCGNKFYIFGGKCYSCGYDPSY